ncbi:hypothetical protein NDU88_007790 [Pleurodeles waltl]|uniref:Uncharacterized protein n=1 Tax=Pleurodeles waltl TaxID=8319 RepID=A0AAV7LUF4_PLEWA|nr:hypothetical protein NDU88_007790 [Pleurodeles waltl]
MEGQPSWCQPHILLDSRVNGGTAVLVPATHTPRLQGQWRDSCPGASHTYSWTAGSMEGQMSWCQPHILLDCRINGGTAVLVPATHTPGQGQWRDSCPGASHTYSWTAGSMEGQPSWCHPHILLDCRINGGTAVLVPATHTPGRQGQWRDSRPGASHTYSWTSMEGQLSWCQPHILLDCRINRGTAILVPATHTPGLQDQWRGSGPGAIHTYSWTAGSLTDSCPGASHTYSWTAGSMGGQLSWNQPHILLDFRVNGGTAILVPATHTPGLPGQWRDCRPGASHTYSWTAGSMEGQPSWCQPHKLLDCSVNGGIAVLVPATHIPGLQGQWRDCRPGASHTYSLTAGSMEGQRSRCHPHILLDCRVTDGQLSWCQPHILLDCRINGGTAVLEPATHTPGLQGQWRDSGPGASHTYSWTAGSMEGPPSWCQAHILLYCRVNGETAVLVSATHTPGLQGQWRDSHSGASHTYSWTAGSMEGQPTWCQPHILLDCRVNGETAVLVPATHTPGLQDQWRDSRHGASHTYSWTAGSMEWQWSRCHPHILLDCGVNGGTADLVPATHTPGLQDQWRDSRPGASHTYSWTAGSMEGQPSWCLPLILLDCRINGGTAVLVPATHTPGLQDQWRDSSPGASHTYSWTAGSMEGQPSWCQPHILLDCRINRGTAILVPATHTPGLQDQWRGSGPGAIHTYSWTAGSLTDSCPGASHTYSWTAGSMGGQLSWNQPHILLYFRVNGGTAILVPATHTPGLPGQWRDCRPGASHTYSWTAGSMEGQPSWCQPHKLLDCSVNGGIAVLVPATHIPGLQGQWRDRRPGASHTYSLTAGSMEGQRSRCHPHILLDCRVTDGQLSWCQPHILLDCRINGGTAVLEPATHTPGLQGQWRDSGPGASHTYSWTAGSMEGPPSWCQAHILLYCRVNGETAVLVPATHTPGLQGQWRDSHSGASHTYSWTAGSMEGQPTWCQPHILLDCRVNGETAVLVPATHTPGLQDQWRDSRHGASHTYSWTAGSMEWQWSRCHPHILLDCGVNGGTADLVPATLQDQWRDSRLGACHSYSWTAGSMEGPLSWCQPHILLDCRVNGGTAVLVPATHIPGLQDQWRDRCPGASHTYSWTAGSMEGQLSWCQPHILLDMVNGGTAVLEPATHTPGLLDQWRDSLPGASHTYSWTTGSMEGQPSWCHRHIFLDCRVNAGTAVLVPATHTPGLQDQ